MMASSEPRMFSWNSALLGGVSGGLLELEGLSGWMATW